MGQDLLYFELDQRSRLPCFAALFELDDLRSLQIMIWASLRMSPTQDIGTKLID